MLYIFLRSLMKVTVRIFFRSVYIRNKDLIPEQGPLMMLANHPSTFMDPIVIATLVDREVFFLAKGELFKSGFAKWLLPKFNMIPVYRKQDDPSQMSRNEETFNKCFEHLEKGGVILMFPEGVSITERKLKPLKSGAARIVLGAEARNNFTLGIRVVNIGLNYEDPHRFNRKLFVNVAEPLTTFQYAASYAQDPFKAVNQLSEDIRQQLEALVIAIEDKKADELVAAIETLYTSRLKEKLGIEEGNSAQEFMITKNIAETVAGFQERSPERVSSMRERIQKYFSKLKELGIRDQDLAAEDQVGGLPALFLIIAGFPLYLYGLLNNFLPFEIPALAARKISKSIEFRGAIGMVGGMFTFLIFYTVQIWLVWKFSHHETITVVYGLSLPLSGLFCYWYYHTVKAIHAQWLLRRFFTKKRVLISELITERQRIIADLDAARIEMFPEHQG